MANRILYEPEAGTEPRPVIASNPETGEVLENREGAWRPIVAKSDEGKLVRYTAKGWEPAETQPTWLESIAMSDAVGEVASFVNDAKIGLDSIVGEFTTDVPDATKDQDTIIDDLVKGFEFAGENIKAGYMQSAQKLYHDAANTAMIIDRAADGISKQTGLEKGEATAQAEKHLRSMAREVVPNHVDEGTLAKIYQGLGAAPVAIAEYMVGIKFLGAVGGFAAVDAIGAADQGVKETFIAGARGALTGGVFKATEPLVRGARATTLGGVMGMEAAIDGGDTSDVVAAATVMGMLGMMGGGGKTRPSDVFVDAKSMVRDGITKLEDVTAPRRFAKAVEQAEQLGAKK